MPSGQKILFSFKYFFNGYDLRKFIDTVGCATFSLSNGFSQLLIFLSAQKAVKFVASPRSVIYSFARFLVDALFILPTVY